MLLVFHFYALSLLYAVSAKITLGNVSIAAAEIWSQEKRLPVGTDTPWKGKQKLGGGGNFCFLHLASSLEIERNCRTCPESITIVFSHKDPSARPSAAINQTSLVSGTHLGEFIAANGIELS